MKIILYTTHCPKCQVLVAKLSSAGLDYEEFSDVDEMSKKGIMSVPMLEVDGNMLDFKQAVDWINKGGAPLS